MESMHMESLFFLILLWLSNVEVNSFRFILIISFIRAFTRFQILSFGYIYEVFIHHVINFVIVIKHKPFSESIILSKLEPFSLKSGLIVFQNALLLVMSFIFKFVK